MVDDLQYQRLKCAICEQNTPSQVWEPLIITQPPGYQFQQTVADQFQLNNQNYLVYADMLTWLVDVSYLTHGVMSNNLIRMFQQYFVRWGSPEESATDRGTNLTSDEVNGSPLCNRRQLMGIPVQNSSIEAPVGLLLLAQRFQCIHKHSISYICIHNMLCGYVLVPLSNR